MSRFERLRTINSDVANVATLVLAFGGAGWIDDKPAIAAVMLAGAAVIGVVQLARHPPWSLGVFERRAVGRYLEGRLSHHSHEFPAGTSPESKITLEDFSADDSLYAEPTVVVSRGVNQHEGFVKWIVDAVRGSRRVLILGEPGQGKTLSVQLAYLSLVRAYLSGGEPALPVLMRLVDVRDHLSSDVDRRDPRLALARLLTEGESGIPISPARLSKLMKRKRVVLFLDGIDELAVHGGTPREVLPPLLEAALSSRVVLTCRSAFFEVHLSSSRQLRDFEARAQIRGVDFATSGSLFVHRFCERLGYSTADQLIALIKLSPSLTDLVTRPLVLFMATDLLAPKLEQAGESSVVPTEWTVAEVYGQYVRKWLKLEREKGVELWQDLEELCEEVAWKIFELAFDGGKPFGLFDAQDLQLNAASVKAVVDAWPDDRPRNVAFTELTTRSFLLRSEGDDYYRFAHKSFFEYFAACRIRTELTAGRADPDSLRRRLQAPLPDEVIDFLRQLLGRCALVPTDRAAIRENLFGLLDESHSSDGDDSTVMPRQQAANLLPIVLVGDESGQQRLLTLHDRESHPFVRRGVAVGFALHLRDGRLIDELLADFDADPDALSFHLGYNRIYYGDQVPGENGWIDDGLPACERFFMATIRQVSNDFYQYLWPMSVRTARVLLADRDRRAHLTAKTDLPVHLASLERFARAHRDSPWQALSEECKELLRWLTSDPC